MFLPVSHEPLSDHRLWNRTRLLHDEIVHGLGDSYQVLRVMVAIITIEREHMPTSGTSAVYPLIDLNMDVFMVFI